MLTLSTEQEAALRALARERATRRLAEALAAAFPELAARAGARLLSLVVHGVERAAGHGIDDAVCIARYLACWCVWGADFETRPDGEWALQILAQPARGQGAKVFQLCRRTAEELVQRVAPGRPTSAVFQAAVALLDERLAAVGVLGALRPTPPVRLGVPCDIDACDLRLVDPGWRLSYRPAEGARWARTPSPPGGDPVVVLATQREPAAGAGEALPPAPPPSWPPQIHLLSPPPGEGAAARLRLRTRATHVCDTRVHPWVGLNSSQGLAEWRGPFAAEATFGLPADPAPPPLRPAMPQPVIALESQPARSVLQASACGLRDAGAPLDTLTTQVAVYPSTQWLMTWQRRPGASAVALERDGIRVDASAWQAGFAALDAKWAEALARLRLAWERIAAITDGRADAETSLLQGDAGLTWGWTEAPRALADTPAMRLEGRCDLTALALRLRLSGELALEGSRSRLQLNLDADTRWQATWQRDHAHADWATALQPAQLAFRHPFGFALTPIASAELAIANVAGSVSGALVGACGLRRSAEGPGLQWFAHLAVEAASVPLTIHHPLRGTRRLVRPLLPALVLLDWSLG